MDTYLSCGLLLLFVGYYSNQSKTSAICVRRKHGK